MPIINHFNVTGITDDIIDMAVTPNPKDGRRHRIPMVLVLTTTGRGHGADTHWVPRWDTDLTEEQYRDLALQDPESVGSIVVDDEGCWRLKPKSNRKRNILFDDLEEALRRRLAAISEP